jgi:uncharacterized protein YuzE
MWFEIADPQGVMYDDDEDVIYFTLGQSNEAVTVALADGLFVDLDTATQQIVGIELIQFKRKFCAAYPMLAQAWDAMQRAQRKLVEQFSAVALAA